jgi:hypothetical protein
LLSRWGSPCLRDSVVKRQIRTARLHGCVRSLTGEGSLQYSQDKFAKCFRALRDEVWRVAFPPSGRLAQLVRAPALQAGGRRFESCTAHHIFNYSPSLLFSYSAVECAIQSLVRIEIAVCPVKTRRAEGLVSFPQTRAVFLKRNCGVRYRTYICTVGRICSIPSPQS